MENTLNSALFIPHGGGPLPLFEDKGHLEMISFLQKIPNSIATPSAIIIISAHWECDEVTITSANNPDLIYDYSGFAKEAYDITYPASGNPKLARKVQALMQNNGIKAHLDKQRGFDHGLFVPLTLMYPKAQIPCIQISLVKDLDPATHIQIDKALSALKNDNTLIIGSGLSFHNMKAFSDTTPDDDNEAFEQWLIDTSSNPNINEDERKNRLIHWNQAPAARYCHPREEHLMPLHVCYGFAESAGELVFDGKVMNKKVSAYIWESTK